MRHHVSLLLALCCLTTTAGAWGTKEHIQLTRIAAQRLIDDAGTPPAMKQWLRDASPERYDMEGERQWFMNQRQGIIPRGVDGLPFWSVIPDTTVLMEGREEKKVEPFGVRERLLHYIDLELLLSGDQKREYRHDLSGKPKKSEIVRDMKDPRYAQAGMLPFRVEDAYRKLVEQLRAGRLVDQAGQFPRDEHATKWAGYLAHYIQDNTQPHHATIDYKSATYFTDKRKAPNVHAQMEYMMADDDKQDHMKLREEFWLAFVKALDEVKDPIETDDPWEGTVEVALASYDALPMIGEAAMKGAGQGGTPQKPQGPASDRFDTAAFFHSRGTYQGREMSVLEMKARQQAWAVKRTQRLWLQAWNEAHKDQPPKSAAAR
jgi:hypothetical protein